MQDHRKRLSPFWRVVLGLAAIGVLFTAAGFVCSIPIHVTHYTVAADIEAPIRIVHLTDLHGRELGQDNSRLIREVLKAEPDAIFITGDMLSRSDPDADVVLRLISRLRGTAPIYYSYGNHEYVWVQRHSADLEKQLRDAGAEVLYCDYLDTELNGQPVRIGGYYNYFMRPHMMSDNEDEIQAELLWAEDFMDTDRQKLLLNHIPTTWVDWNLIDDFDAGVVFSGHYHGGQIRLFGQGLYAPYVGFLPKYTRGLYVGKCAACVLSAGVGNERQLPRVFNPPEICVVELVPGS